MIFICFINVYKIIIARIYDLDIIQLFRTVYLHYLVHRSILAKGIIFCFMFVSLPLDTCRRAVFEQLSASFGFFW